MNDKVWMQPPDGGDPQEVSAEPATLVPLMVAGWKQVFPAPKEEDQ